MARFLLLVCLWAVVLPAVIEKCHADGDPGTEHAFLGQTCDKKTGQCTCELPKVMDNGTCTACPKKKVEECAGTGQTCDKKTGQCTCELPKVMDNRTCTACPKKKVEECAGTGKSCDEKTGQCTCELPKEMDGGNCTACPKKKVEECAGTGKSCDEKTGQCTCELPKEMDGGNCTACPKKKVEECAGTGKTCDEKTGQCTCELPKEMDGGTCKVCPKKKVEECAGTGQTCDEKTGQCTCELPKEMDGGTCKVCPKKKVEECAGTGQTCDEKTGQCTCELPKEMDGGTCKDALTMRSSLTPDITTGETSQATEATTTPSTPTKDISEDPCKQKLQECQNGKKTSCKVVDGTPTCVCPSSMKETENGDCFVAKKITVKFTLKLRNKRSTTYGQHRNCRFNITVLIEEIMDTVPNAIEESIVCSGNDVSFDVFAENEDAETEIKNVFNNCTKDDCSLGSSIHFASNSFKFEAKDMCKEEETKKLAEQMGMTCKFNSTTEMLCNKEKTMAIGTANVQGIPFQICRALPCHQTCKNENMSCVQESCVCKPQYKFEDGECKSVCHLKTSVCPAGATCVLGKGDQSFYCECPPKLTGPLCTRENKPLQTAKLNIVVVGVVLASLLLLCFVVSASIISRLRKKVQGPSFSKDCERRPQRELRGYDGPYKASDPASLHRGRDHTSL